MNSKLPLLDVDPDLGWLVPADRYERCRRDLAVDVLRLAQGLWDTGSDPNPQHVGLLVIDGIMSREVVVSDTVSTELLGAGDVIRPWRLQEPAGLLRMTVRWSALTETRVAVLDRRFGAQLGDWPEVNAALIDRLNERAHRLATTQAISQLNRVDRRLFALFWHLAERWGRVTADGVAVPLTLSHRMLGQLVGARRPTVSSAVGELASRNELIRRDDGTWLLKGEPAGAPAADAERHIPIRRRLLAESPPEAPTRAARSAVAGARSGSHVADGRFPVAAEHAAIESVRAELRDTLVRMRDESAVHLEQLQALTVESQRLQGLLATGRERRRRDRQSRGTTR